ncbi:MAG: GTPase HflX [Bacteroidota bacterium]
MTSKKKLIDIEQGARERAVIVGITGPSASRAQAEEYLEELALLVDTAGADVIHRIIQDRNTIDVATFIGKGKAEQIAAIITDENIHLTVFDDDLSSVQIRNLERVLNCKVIDRSGLILDIFTKRAKSNEARTQVALAQYEYLLPRLTRQWTHLSKQYGGIGTKGPGETQIETDRRMIRKRISHLREKLERINQQREIQRHGREELTRVALVGYTNAGKSTLMNLLSQADVLVENRLFATVDSTVRCIPLDAGTKILLSDTVGFIRKLPHNLIASFKSTLAEVTEADILLHVIDISHPLWEEQIAIVGSTLHEISAEGKSTMMVFNKIDLLEDRGILELVGKKYQNNVCISAARAINISTLKEKLSLLVQDAYIDRTFIFSQNQYDLIARIHDVAEVLSQHYAHDHVEMHIRVRQSELDRLVQLFPKHTVKSQKQNHNN